MMAEVLPSRNGQMDQGKAHMGMPQYWASPDERDAYIEWLKSEFAAANALIDSMCHHMRCIGGPGEYDLVFGCRNRRRHTWTPSLYMQHFSSVAEVVTALQEVAWKKYQGHCSPPNASVAPKTCPSCQAQSEEAHESPQLRNNPRNNTHVNSTAKLQQSDPARIECCRMSNKDVSRPHVKASPETGEVETAYSPNSALSTFAELCIIECDEKTSDVVDKASSTAHVRNSREEVTSANDTGKHLNGQASLLNKGLEIEKLLNTEISIASEEEDARLAKIKRSMQFQCCGHMDGRQINDGESVELCEHVFSNEELHEIIEIIGQLQAAGRQGELGCAFRGRKKSSCLPDILQFGPKLDDCLCFPKFLLAIIRWLTSCGILSPKRSPDSCLISIFDEGNFEAPNTDQGAWEKPLCVVSLMEDCSMVFGHSITADQYGSCKGPFQVALPAGSVLLLRETFTGILQKAIPASPSRRVTIALGKAVSTSSAEQNGVNAAGKVNNKHWEIGGARQARLPPNLGLWSHQCPLALPHMQFPPPSLRQNLPGLMLYPPAVAFPRLLGGSSAGTGVFFPSCDASVSMPTSWHSLLLSSTSIVGSSRSVHSKRAGVHAGVKGSFDSKDTKVP